jgi:hypothetical protein
MPSTKVKRGPIDQGKKACIFPLYITKAAYSPDPLERFKLVIVATISSFYWTNTFLKPVVWGEVVAIADS